MSALASVRRTSSAAAFCWLNCAHVPVLSSGPGTTCWPYLSTTALYCACGLYSACGGGGCLTVVGRRVGRRRSHVWSWLCVWGGCLHQNLLPNNNDAQSTTKYGLILRPDTQIVALHCTRTALKAPPKNHPTTAIYPPPRRVPVARVKQWSRGVRVVFILIAGRWRK